MRRAHGAWERTYARWYRRVSMSLVPLTNQGSEWRHQATRWPELIGRFGTGQIVELGAGSGYLSAWLRRFGWSVECLDWAESSGECCRLLGLPWFPFDMRWPRAFPTKGKTLITSGALEQIIDWRPLLTWFLRSEAAMIIHKEPLVELCGSSCRRSIAQHRTHGLQEGFVDSLPVANILHRQHLTIGKRYHAYSELVWKP